MIKIEHGVLCPGLALLRVSHTEKLRPGIHADDENLPYFDTPRVQFSFILFSTKLRLISNLVNL